MSATSLMVLGYHRVGPPDAGGWETWFSVPTSVFEEHLALVEESPWTPIDGAALVEGLRDPASLPERPLVITFDDGYVCTRSRAAPLLAARRMPAVLFVPTDHIGKRNDFDPGEPPGAICDWDDLRSLESHGVAVQSHAASHRHFDELSLDEQIEELRRSKDVLEDGLGRPVTTWAYPFGARGSRPVELAAAARSLGYAGACVYPGGGNPLPVADPFGIRRIAVGPDTDLRALLRGDQHGT